MEAEDPSLRRNSMEEEASLEDLLVDLQHFNVELDENDEGQRPTGAEGAAQQAQAASEVGVNEMPEVTSATVTGTTSISLVRNLVARYETLCQ